MGEDFAGTENRVLQAILPVELGDGDRPAPRRALQGQYGAQHDQCDRGVRVVDRVAHGRALDDVAQLAVRLEAAATPWRHCSELWCTSGVCRGKCFPPASHVADMGGRDRVDGETRPEAFRLTRGCRHPARERAARANPQPRRVLLDLLKAIRPRMLRAMSGLKEFTAC